MENYLNDIWAYFYADVQFKENYSDQYDLKILSTCYSIEQFWRIQNNLCLPSQLNIGLSYYFLKTDHQNDKDIVFTLERDTPVDKIWEMMLLFTISSSMKYSEYILGISIKVTEEKYLIFISIENLDFYKEIFHEYNSLLKEYLDIETQIGKISIIESSYKF